MGDSTVDSINGGILSGGIGAIFPQAFGQHHQSGPDTNFISTDDAGQPNREMFDTGKRTGFVQSNRPAGSVFDLYKQALPSAMNQNEPIRDPSAILNMYKKNIGYLSSKDQTTNLDPTVQMPQFNPDQMGWSWQQWLNAFK